jgi:ketosteroid isomerase-like protein
VGEARLAPSGSRIEKVDMAKDNVETVKRAIGAFNRRDVDALAELTTADFEWFPAFLGAVEGDSHRGRQGIEAYFRAASETWEDVRLLGEDFRELGGDRVLMLGRVEGRGRGSGAQVDAPHGVVWNFRGGRISRVRAYLDHGDALRAAGLAE